MIRWLLFAALAAVLVGYAFWVYLKVDLAVPNARRLALLRALTLIVVLTLLFDVRVPTDRVGGASTEWVLLDASLSMGAAEADGASAWARATDRARELAGDGYDVVTFGGDPPTATPNDLAPTELGSLLVPALQRAAEGGARSVVVLSDQRFGDAVAIEAALATLPLEVAFEDMGAAVVNAGVTRFELPDFVQPEAPVTAAVELVGGVPGEPLTVEILAEDEVVATVEVPAPEPGLRATTEIEVPPPEAEGRVRYSAVVRMEGDAFAADDRVVDYAAVGREEGALVLLSLRPDWEPRFLLPVLREVTGLPTVGYLRAGADRFVQAGRAVDRGGPVDSVTVRQAVADAALLVVHGLTDDADAWTRSVARPQGRRIFMVQDVGGASAAGLEVSPGREGEWYVSADVPASPIAGALSGASLQGLPPLTGVLVAREPTGAAPLQLQLRGAGPPVPALYLEDRPTGRVAVVTASGFWRWAARESGRDAYRRLWSGVIGWLLADQTVVAAEPRPVEWVVARGAPVVWTVPVDSASARIVVEADSTVVDTVVTGGGTFSTGTLPPASYRYRVEGAAGDTLGSGRFDVAEASSEMVPAARTPIGPAGGGALVAAARDSGRPLRTSPWPYLLVIGLLCGEWIGRRRSGLR